MIVSEKTKVDKMAVLIAKSLEEYKDVAISEVKKIAKSVAKDVKKDIQEHAPKKTGRYKKSWTVKTVTDSALAIELVVHSKDRYMLTHLLENGHALRNGGRTRAFPHIKPAEERGIQKLEDDVKKALEKGKTS